MFQVMVPRSAQKAKHEQLETNIRTPPSFLSREDSATILIKFSRDMALVDIAKQGLCPPDGCDCGLRAGDHLGLALGCRAGHQAHSRDRAAS